MRSYVSLLKTFDFILRIIVVSYDLALQDDDSGQGSHDLVAPSDYLRSEENVTKMKVEVQLSLMRCTFQRG